MSVTQHARGDAPVYFERDRGVTEVHVTRGLAHVTARFSHQDLAAKRLALLQELAGAGISVFLVKLHPDAISFAVRSDAVDPCEALLSRQGLDYTLLRDLALVTIVAGAMRDLPGVMARIYGAMLAVEVRVQQTGDAYNAVLCLLAGDEAERAAGALRQTFSLAAGAGVEAP